MAPTLCNAIGDRCLLRAGDLEVIIDFPFGEVREYIGENYGFRFEIQRELVETVVAQQALSTGATRCSCRAGSVPGVPARSTSTSTTSSSRCRPSACAAPRPRPCRRLDPDRDDLAGEEIRIGDYIVQRLCPHRLADLSVFGEIDDDRVRVHAARLAIRPGDRPLLHRRRSQAADPPRHRLTRTTAQASEPRLPICRHGKNCRPLVVDHRLAQRCSTGGSR